jgi:hypothetical protein
MNEVQSWKNKLSKAKKKWDEYHDLVKEIRGYYINKSKRNKQNIFWSSIETLKPFIYFKAPVPYVERKNKNNNPVEAAACEILEKALVWDLEQQDFDGVIKYARNDFLLSGLGLTYEKFEPTIEQVAMAQVDPITGESLEVQAEILTDAKVTTCYIDPKDLIMDTTNVKVWEDVEWVAQSIEMTKQEVIDQFGKNFAKKLLDGAIEPEKDKETETKVYRIWDKKGKRVLYVSEILDEFLRVDDDFLKVEGFYPFPKPIFATLSNHGVIPTPDYTEIKCMLDELDGINTRMKNTMQALKVSGVYDSSFSELKDLLNKDTTLVSVTDFQKVREKGGIDGFVGFMPIEQYISALQTLSERRTQLIQAIYEITGVSDIMRGNSNPEETATAVTKKTNFGTLRNQDRQNDFQRFLTDVLKIKAEIICEQFTPELLMQFANNINPEVFSAAVQLLKTDKLRNLSLGIETDTSFLQSEELEKTNEAVKTIHEMITAAFQVVSAQPALLPLYKQMIESVVVTLPSARQFNTAIDETFARIEQDLAKPEQEEPNPEMMKAQADMMRAQADQVKNANEYQVKQEANAIKEQEVQLKKQAEDNKVLMANKEADMQYDLKQQELAIQGQTNENITTGYVGAF